MIDYAISDKTELARDTVEYQTVRDIGTNLIGLSAVYAPLGAIEPYSVEQLAESYRASGEGVTILSVGETVTIVSVFPIWYGHDKADNPIVYVRGNYGGNYTHVSLSDLVEVS